MGAGGAASGAAGGGATGAGATTPRSGRWRYRRAERPAAEPKSSVGEPGRKWVRHRCGKGLGRELRDFRRGRWHGWRLGGQRLDRCWRREIRVGTVWTLADVTEAPSAGGFAACGETVFPLSAEPAVSDSAAPTTAIAAAVMVTFLAFDTNQGRSGRDGGSFACVSASCKGRTAETFANAAPRARASWVSTESKTGIGRASPIGPATSSRSSRAPTRCKLSGNQPSLLKTEISQSMRSVAWSRV